MKRHPLSESWPPLRETELLTLRESIAAGFDPHHPIVLHEGMVLDGWHRYEAAQAAGVEPVFVDYAGADPAGYVIARHRGRRNLSVAEMGEAVVRCRAWRPEGRPTETVSNETVSGAQMAEEAGVSLSTINRAKAKVRDERAVHVAQATGEYEWYTPRDIVERVRQVLGGTIDLDPCTSEAAQGIIGATLALTAEDDALNPETLWMPEDGEWGGAAFLNPPYAASLIPRFADRLLAELDAGTLTRAIWLSNNATETAWGRRLLDAAESWCFPTTRIRFLAADLEPRQAPLQGQMILGFGDIDRSLFMWVFSDIGAVR